MLIPKIETERLRLQMYKAEDLAIVYKMLSDKNVTRFYPPGYSIKREDVLSSMPRRLCVGVSKALGSSAFLKRILKN